MDLSVSRHAQSYDHIRNNPKFRQLAQSRQQPVEPGAAGAGKGEETATQPFGGGRAAAQPPPVACRLDGVGDAMLRLRLPPRSKFRSPRKSSASRSAATSSRPS